MNYTNIDNVSFNDLLLNGHSPHIFTHPKETGSTCVKQHLPNNTVFGVVARATT